MVDPATLNSAQGLVTVFVAVAAVMVPIWWDIRKQRTKQHEEALEKFKELLDEQEERPNHRHGEKPGQPLMADGILYAPRRRYNGH
jgi:hypothetical protein